MAKRTVCITLNEGTEDYLFKGIWTGSDVKHILTHFPRQYKLYARTVKRTQLGIPIGSSKLDKLTQFNKANKLDE